MNFRCKFRHQRSICRPRFPIRVQNFSDLATFSVGFFAFYMLNVGHISTSGLTHWPRKYTTRVDPHIDYSFQVWSWYDHTLPSYSVFVCWYVTWPCDLDVSALRHLGHLKQITWFRACAESHTFFNTGCLLTRHVTFWPWTVAVHGGSRDLHWYQVWRPHAYPFLIYES